MDQGNGCDRQTFLTSPFAAFTIARAHLLLAREMERFARRRLFRHHHQADTSVSKIEGAGNGVMGLQQQPAPENIH
jgi:hypothetical protein